MNKLFFIILNTTQVILFATAYILDYLSRKKMGFMRYFVYKNNKLNDSYNMENIINILCFIIIFIMIFSIINFIIFIFNKKRKIYFYSKYFTITNISLTLLGLFFLIFFQYFSRDNILAFYYIILIFIIIYMIEFIKLIIIIKKNIY